MFFILGGEKKPVAKMTRKKNVSNRRNSAERKARVT